MRRLFLVSSILAFSVLSCGKAPKSFDVSASRGPVETQSRTQNLNAVAAADEALHMQQAIAFVVGETTRRRNSAVLWIGSLRAAPDPPLVAAVSPTSSGLEPCGGDLPPCEVKQRESGGDYRAVNPTGCGGYSCGGAWQFDPRTWNGYGGYEFAQDAPPEVQDAKARELYANGAGASHWGL